MLVVLLKSFQKLGHFPSLDEMPEPAVGHVRGLLALDEDVQPPHDTDRTLRHHRTIIRERLGVEYDKGARADGEVASGGAAGEG